ncbi:hypothetical protein ACOY72_15605 [Acinetobacter seifertii]|uniref:hypothetical protein n=1 Tax=Acinetobacter seifertii TaxID=1530123 RepID=UPI003BE379E9
MTNRSKKVVTKDTVDAHEFASEASETVAEKSFKQKLWSVLRANQRKPSAH